MNKLEEKLNFIIDVAITWVVLRATFAFVEWLLNAIMAVWEWFGMSIGSLFRCRKLGVAITYSLPLALLGVVLWVPVRACQMERWDAAGETLLGGYLVVVIGVYWRIFRRA